MSDGFLLMAMASILLSSSKISQLTNVHNKKLQASLLLPVYFSFFNFKMINLGLKSTVQREVKERAKKARTVSLYRPLGWGHTPIRCEISIGLPLVQNNLLTI